MGEMKFAKILVTGASGFVGGHLARVLVERGYPVRAIYRREKIPENLERVRERGAEVVRLDLTGAEDVRKAVQGVEAVIHVAALTGDWGPYEIYKRHNYDLTVRLIDEAEKSGCRVFVCISSIAVHGFWKHVNSSEEGPYYRHVSAYQATKKMAEEHVLARNSRLLRTTAIRPGNIYGPGDTTTFYRFFKAQEKGIIGTLGGGKSLTCPVYIDDLIEAIILSLENEKSAGEVFNITGGEEVTWGDILSYTASLLGVKPRLTLPIPLAYFLAVILGGFYLLFRLKSVPPLNLYRVTHVAHDFHFSIAKAREILGYSPNIGWQEGMRRTVEAYLQDKRG